MLGRWWKSKPFALDLGLLILRIGVALLMAQYGWSKFNHFAERAVDFPDPLHVTRTASLALTIFAELGCSTLLLFGLFSRLALIPLTFTMVIAVLVIHADDPFRTKEHAISFLIPYVTLFLAGPGRYSLDHLLKK